jgi:hypothetical protein
MALTQQGRIEEARSACRDAVEHETGSDSLFLREDLALTDAWIAVWEGDYDAVVRNLSTSLELDYSGPHSEYPPRLLQLGLQAAADKAKAARASGDSATLGAALPTGRSYAAGVAEIARSVADERDHPMHWRGRVSLVVAEAEVARLEGTPGIVAWQRAIDETVAWHARPLEAYARWRRVEAMVSAQEPREAVVDAYRSACEVAKETGQVAVSRELADLGNRLGLPF